MDDGWNRAGDALQRDRERDHIVKRISVEVVAPEGLPPITVLLTCKPKTRSDFDAVVKAVGGPCAFTYHGEDSAHAKLPDGSTLMLSSPTRRRSYTRPQDPTIAALKAACER